MSTWDDHPKYLVGDSIVVSPLAAPRVIAGNPYSEPTHNYRGIPGETSTQAGQSTRIKRSRRGIALFRARLIAGSPGRYFLCCCKHLARGVTEDGVCRNRLSLWSYRATLKTWLDDISFVISPRHNATHDQWRRICWR